MSKFYVGQKVLVKDCARCMVPAVDKMLGKICEIRSVGNDIMVYQEDKKRAWHFLPDDLEPITETPKEITLNGATYVLKEDPKPEHDWRFGDIATHPDYGVGMVFSEPDEENDVRFAHNGDWDWADIKDLTFLRRADLSV